MIFWYMNAKICNKPFPNCTNNCFSICIIWSQINFKVDTAIYIFSLLLTSKEWPTSSKPKIIQKPQFLSTLFSNFGYFSISTYVSNGKWLNFGLSPLWKTFLILDHCEHKGLAFLIVFSDDDDVWLYFSLRITMGFWKNVEWLFFVVKKRNRFFVKQILCFGWRAQIAIFAKYLK